MPPAIDAKDEDASGGEASWGESSWEEFLDCVVYIFTCFTDVVCSCLITTASKILFSSFCWKSSEGRSVTTGPAMIGALVNGAAMMPNCI